MKKIPNLMTIKPDGTHFILWELRLPLVRSQQLLVIDGSTAAPEKWIECSGFDFSGRWICQGFKDKSCI